MASTNTTVLKDRFLDVIIEESGSSGTDWYASQDLKGFEKSGLLIKSITWFPTAANDVMIIRHSTDGTDVGGPIIWYKKCASLTGDHRITFEPPMRMNPAIDVSEITLGGTTGTGRLLFELV